MPDSDAHEITYDSVYRQRLDEKRRVPVPHRWRSGKSEDFHLMIWPQHKAGVCLRVISPGQMTALRQKINAMADEDPRKVVLRRFIGSRSATVSVDNAGRIAIPEEMTTAAGIKSDAVFVGALDFFEIWNAERYADADKMDEAILNDAIKLMG